MLLKQMSKIEGKTDEGISRKRGDATRCAVYRALSKVPLWILTKLVSVGDRKHRSAERLYRSYSVAYSGFINIQSLLFQRKSDASILNTSGAIVNDTLIDFSAIHFPQGKVVTIALECYNARGNIDDLFIAKKNPSMKTIEALKSNNEVISPLIEFVLRVVEQDGTLPKCTKALLDLKNL